MTNFVVRSSHGHNEGLPINPGTILGIAFNYVPIIAKPKTVLGKNWELSAVCRILLAAFLAGLITPDPATGRIAGLIALHVHVIFPFKLMHTENYLKSCEFLWLFGHNDMFSRLPNT